jgi:hypothetical protein
MSAAAMKVPFWLIVCWAVPKVMEGQPILANSSLSEETVLFTSRFRSAD